MAKRPRNTSAAIWHTMVCKRAELIDKNRENQSQETEAQISELEDQLLNMRAADFDGVILKLGMLFEQYMHEQSREAYQHLMIIGDLRYLTSK